VQIDHDSKREAHINEFFGILLLVGQPCLKHEDGPQAPGPIPLSTQMLLPYLGNGFNA
jgi:hypothetical protein